MEISVIALLTILPLATLGSYRLGFWLGQIMMGSPK